MNDHATQDPFIQNLADKLYGALAPHTQIEIINQSASHSTHQEAITHATQKGVSPEHTHFRILITSQSFASLNRIERYRLIHAILSEELRTQIHALSLSLHTPEENALNLE